jgi:hypothetical protein
MSFRSSNLCICCKPQCFSIQTQLCELAKQQTTGGVVAAAEYPTILNDDVWCHPRPIKIKFNPNTSNYRTWILIVSICHHYPVFQKNFLSSTDFDSVDTKKRKEWHINRIHFTRALLENRSGFKVAQYQAILSPSLAEELASFDDVNKKQRMTEYVNTVAFLDGLAQRILPTAALQKFQLSRPQQVKKLHYYVQAPVGPLNEAKLYLSSLLKASLSKRKDPPPPSLLSSTVTPSPATKKRKIKDDGKDPFHFIDALVASNPENNPTSPVRNATTAESPLKNIVDVDECRDNIVAGFASKSRNFFASLRAYRVYHEKYHEPIQINDAWLYACTAEKCKSEGFLYLKHRLRIDYPQLCSGCLKNHKQGNRKEYARNQRSSTKTRLSPITAMTDDDKTKALKTLQRNMKRCTQSNKRLRERLCRKSPVVTINSVSDGMAMVKKVYKYISKRKLEASKMIVDAIIDMETLDRIPIERQKDRDRYAEFIVSDIMNACKTFTGNSTQIRFHPIMANLAMLLYMGMKYEDIVDASPFVFPTVRTTIQRNRAKIATQEGTDPKVYARVSEMSGFKTKSDMLVHWMFDEVKLTSGVMWNARNDVTKVCRTVSWNLISNNKVLEYEEDG